MKYGSSLALDSTAQLPIDLRRNSYAQDPCHTYKQSLMLLDDGSPTKETKILYSPNRPKYMRR